jgi:alpha-1,2-mannosyltransferase
VTRIRPTGWLAAAIALFLLAVAGYALLVHTFPQYYWTQTDATVYRAAGIAVRHLPARLYSLRLGEPKDPFLYTPFAGLLFALPSVMSFGVWQVALAVLTIGLLPIVAYAALSTAGRPAGTTARVAAAFAIAAVGLWLEPVAETLFFGQLNLVLLALVIGDLALPDRFKGKGIAIGVAAAIKLTPLIFVAYLLFSRRVRAGLVGVATFVATIVLGFALLPHASAVYWGGWFAQSHLNPWHLLNQSVYGAILRYTHVGSHAYTYWLAAAVVIGILGLATSVVASRRGHELLGVVTCVATELLVSPISYSHDYVVVVPALALAAVGPRRLGCRIAGVAFIVVLFGWWPIRISPEGGYDAKAQLLPRGLLRLAPNHGNDLEFHWRGLELIFGNYYVVTALAFVVVAACALAITRHRTHRAGGADAAPTARFTREPGTVR